MTHKRVTIKEVMRKVAEGKHLTKEEKEVLSRHLKKKHHERHHEREHKHHRHHKRR